MKNIYLKIHRPAKAFFVLLLILNFIGVLQAQEKNSFRAQRHVTGGAHQAGEKNSIKYTVMMGNKEKYSVTVLVDYDLPIPELKVFDDGAAVLVNSFDGSLTFFDGEGKEIAKEFILKELPVAYERSVYASVSGETLAVALSQPDRDYAILGLYYKSGQLISSWQIDEKHLGGLCYSKQNQLTAVSVYDWEKDKLNKSTVFYNSGGEKISRIPLAFKKGKFVEDERLFMGYSNTACFVYDVNAKKLKFRQSVLKDEMIIGMDYSQQRITVESARKPFLKNGKWYYQNPSFTRLNLKGEVVQKWQEKGEPFSR